MNWKMKPKLPEPALLRERERQDPNCPDHLQTAGAPVHVECCPVVPQHRWHTDVGLWLSPRSQRLCIWPLPRGDCSLHMQFVQLLSPFYFLV